jgi:hypothetical protein
VKGGEEKQAGAIRHEASGAGDATEEQEQEQDRGEGIEYNGKGGRMEEASLIEEQQQALTGVEEEKEEKGVTVTIVGSGAEQDVEN